jgi:hypothetical protein
MAQATTLILLPQTSYNSTSVVGNAITGSQTQAAAYYLGNKDLQTVTWGLTSVTALISIQATLAETPTDDDWFTVYNLSCVDLSQNSFTNVTGNFVWLRAKVTGFTTGVIQNIKVSY